MAKITGIGGVFFKSKGDRVALAAWYQKHLGMALEDFGVRGSWTGRQQGRALGAEDLGRRE
jgi:hypothetical protein